MKKDKKIYFKLFFSTFCLSAFTFGGGYVIISLMKKKFVDELEWITEEEMLNLAAISQSSPGAVAVNASILLGYGVAGVPGAILSIIGTICPPLIIISVISLFYTAFRDNVVVSAVLKGMQSGVVAVIVDVVINLGSSIVKEKSIVSILLMIGVFVASFFFNVNVVIIILICGVIGGIRVTMSEKKALKGGKS